MSAVSGSGKRSVQTECPVRVEAHVVGARGLTPVTGVTVANAAGACAPATARDVTRRHVPGSSWSSLDDGVIRDL
jgi:hypothetical protein